MQRSTAQNHYGSMTSEKESALGWIESNSDLYKEIAEDIWRHPELSLVEFRAAEKLTALLENNGFTIRKGISHMPTAFVATWGESSPVIGFLAEYDALPNLSQRASTTEHSPIITGAPGHGCGHNLLGTSSCFAGIATRVAMKKHGIKGTIKIFGTPAEETLVGKVFMARDGVFDHTDMMITWHPEETNGVDYKSFLALNSIKFRFSGRSSHGGSAPEAGRSALDAAELMSTGANYMRGHIIQDARVMHVINRGGEVPNNVPPDAEIWYFVRAPRRSQVDEVCNWLRDIARGAALMTQTKMNHQLLTATYEVLPNKVLAGVGDLNATLIGPPSFSEADQEFGRDILKSMGISAKAFAFDTGLTHPDLSRTFPDIDIFKASTDVGNVSWMFPTLTFSVATKARGTPQHSWQMV
ncbi:MAG: amidohydrolase, partial [Desulfatiglandaceae bacterium]